jgi:hypothetical protein
VAVTGDLTESLSAWRPARLAFLPDAILLRIHLALVVVLQCAQFERHRERECPVAYRFAGGLVKLPRKSRHLDLTREEVSDAESRAEEN